MRLRQVLVMLSLAGLATACVSPARSFEAYEEKAARTAEDALAAIGTAQLSVKDAVERKGTAPFLTVLVAEAEKDAGAAQGTFDSIQPPDPRSDALQKELDTILDDATSVLMDLRILARRGQLARGSSADGDLSSVEQKLNDFIEAHS